MTAWQLIVRSRGKVLGLADSCSKSAAAMAGSYGQTKAYSH